MTIQLLQATASQEVPLGHFLDASTLAPRTDLTIAAADIQLWKAGATALAAKNSGGAAHMAGGVYVATLDATDTSTAGPLVLFVRVDGALPVRLECMVSPAAPDAQLADIKAKTSQLAFGAAGAVNANITHVIADAVQAGSSKATNWGGTP